MRAVFSVGAKLLGLYFLYLGLFSVISSTLSLVDYANQTLVGVRIFIVFGFLTALLQLVSGVLLITKTEWFVQLARLEETDATSLETNGLLALGVSLIGVAMFANTISPFVTDFFLYFFRESFDVTASARVVWVNLLNLAVAFSLIVFAKRISVIITRRQSV